MRCSEVLDFPTAYRRANLKNLKMTAGSQIIRSETSAETAQDWMLSHRNELDLSRTVDRLAAKNILFIGGWNDTSVPIELHMIPLYRKFQERNPYGSKLVLFDCDHTFNAMLPELHKCILNWIKN